MRRSRAGVVIRYGGKMLREMGHVALLAKCKCVEYHKRYETARRKKNVT